MGKRCDYGAVPKQAFAAMVDWLEDAWNREIDYPELTDAALGDKRGLVQKLLKKILAGDWPSGNRKYATFMCQENQEKYFRSISTQVRKALAVACRELGFRHCAQTTKDKLEFRVAWGDFDWENQGTENALSGAGSRVKHVAWLRIPYRSDDSEVLLLGAHSMARTLEVGLDVRELTANGSLFDEILALAKNAEQTDEGGGALQATAFVLELADTAEAGFVRQRLLSNCRVVNTGFRGAAVSHDDTAIGIELAEALLRYFGSNAPTTIPKVAVIAARADFEHAGNGDRVLGFEKCIEARTRTQGQAGWNVERIGVDCHGHRHPHELCSRLLGKRTAGSILDFDAVFTVTGDIGEYLLHVLHHLPHAERPLVFSADISPALLNLMLEPDSKLQAVCGVEPYSYGQLILRVACDASATSPIQVQPVCISRAEVMNAGVANYAQLLARYPNMLLSEPEYAWPAWMRERQVRG